MFTYGGNNNFGKRFDFFEWNAPFYENRAEVYRALEESGIKGKKIAAVNVIGYVGTVDVSALYNKIIEAGIKPASDWYQSYENLNRILVPHHISANEPLQLVLDDGKTFEILPTEGGGARIGVNSISAGLVDGLNKSNFNSKKFYKDFIGKEISSIDLEEIRTETKYFERYALKRDDGYVESRTEHIIKIGFEYPFQLRLTQDLRSCYSIDASMEYIRERIPYKKVRDAKKNVRQVIITNGRDGGGTFRITGFNRSNEKCDERFSYDCFGISIDDRDVGSYLWVFLDKYFDPSIQKREYGEDVEFDWYGFNYYSTDTVRKMVKDIRETAKLLKNKFDDPSLDKLKSDLPWFDFYSDDWWIGSKPLKKMTDEQKNEFRRKHISVTLDFYNRFCSRMEKMIEIPGNDTISFSGP